MVSAIARKEVFGGNSHVPAPYFSRLSRRKECAAGELLRNQGDYLGRDLREARVGRASKEFGHSVESGEDRTGFVNAGALTKMAGGVELPLTMAESPPPEYRDIPCTRISCPWLCR
jgi:hypothetical protein